jgi:hypothetical protein
VHFRHFERRTGLRQQRMRLRNRHGGLKVLLKFPTLITQLMRICFNESP